MRILLPDPKANSVYLNLGAHAETTAKFVLVPRTSSVSPGGTSGEQSADFTGYLTHSNFKMPVIF